MRLQAVLNGARVADTPHLPVTAEQLARDARTARKAGAFCLHIHPRGPNGEETLDPSVTAAALAAVRAAVPGMGVGVSTGDWIAPRATRHAHMQAWQVLPDYVSINLSEPDAPDVMAIMRQKGVPIEIGLTGRADLERLLALPDPVTGVVRVLIEMILGGPLTLVRAEATATLALLRDRLPHLPVLLHGMDANAWAFVALARDLGCEETRIGMEDVLTLPNGQPADNDALIRAALTMAGIVPAFPRTPDGAGHAWGFTGTTPLEIWERFSPAYEAQAERLARAYAAAGFRAELSGAGSEDGEFVVGVDTQGQYHGLTHLEDPAEARAWAEMDDQALAAFLAERLAGCA